LDFVIGFLKASDRARRQDKMRALSGKLLGHSDADAARSSGN
jgi:hypothetical protein